MTFELEGHAVPNLVYQLDCLAGIMPCSTAAFHALWHEQLGWSADDDAAIVRWRHLRQHFEGELHEHERPQPKTLVRVGDGSSGLGERQRWAGFDARGADDFVRLVNLVSAAGDADRLGAIVRRFEPRFARWWPTVAPRIDTFARQSAELLRQPRITALADQALRFYETDAGAGIRAPIHFVWRPDLGGQHDTHGQMLGGPSVVEILAGETAEKRMPVVLHELFHVFYARQPVAARARMLDAFAARPEPHALPALALLNEALATALGNGLIDAVLEPEINARTRAKPLGLYYDERINDAALGLLRAGTLERLLATETLSSPAFVDAYVQATLAAFPGGVRPMDTLRVFAGASSEALAPARRALRKASRANDASGWTPIDAAVVTAVREHPRQTMALFVTPAELDLLTPLVPTETLRRLRASTRTSFVDATSRGAGSYLYVFVAPDLAAAQTLVERFVAQTTLFEGTL